MNCKKCGSALSPGSIICNVCGEQVDENVPVMAPNNSEVKEEVSNNIVDIPTTEEISAPTPPVVETPQVAPTPPINEISVQGSVDVVPPQVIESNGPVTETSKPEKKKDNLSLYTVIGVLAVVVAAMVIIALIFLKK